ncbi:MAG: hypothetical protein Fues2KO_05570 [Fuerstiella sp.]
MISQTPTTESERSAEVAAVVLVRYGRMPQVARFAVEAATLQQYEGGFVRNDSVVVESERGPEAGRVLQVIREGIHEANKPNTGRLLRKTTIEDEDMLLQQQQRAAAEFAEWHQRITDWQLQLQLIDLEWTLDDQNVILYVLNDQNAETTRLALLAAAAGMGIVQVQPVSAEGVIPPEPKGGGCGSGGCSNGGCH